jgi:hypothetical protein
MLFFFNLIKHGKDKHPNMTEKSTYAKDSLKDMVARL